MKRRDFLQHTTAALAAAVFPISTATYASANPPSEALLRSLPADFLADHKFSFTIISASTQAKVDAGIKDLIEHRVENGKSIAVYADQDLSDDISIPNKPETTIWIARNDTFPWLKKDHPIHDNPELRFWARLRDDPDTVAIQHFADGCQFPRSGRSSEPCDILAEAFMTGHSVITGIVAPDPDAVAQLFAASVTDYHYRDDLDKIRLAHDGADRSQELRTNLFAAWA